MGLITSDGPFPHFACSSTSFDLISFLTTYVFFFFTDKQLRRPWQTPSKIYDVMHVSAETNRRRRHLYFPFCAYSSLRSVSSSQDWWFWYCEKKKSLSTSGTHKSIIPYPVSIIPYHFQLNLSGLCMKAMLACLVHAKVVDTRHLNMHSATHPVQGSAVRLRNAANRAVTTAG